MMDDDEEQRRRARNGKKQYFKHPQRDSAITVRLSEDERRKLEAYAIACDLSFTQVIRRIVRDLPAPVTTGEDS